MVFYHLLFKQYHTHKSDIRVFTIIKIYLFLSPLDWRCSRLLAIIRLFLIRNEKESVLIQVWHPTLINFNLILTVGVIF